MLIKKIIKAGAIQMMALITLVGMQACSSSSGVAITASDSSNPPACLGIPAGLIYTSIKSNKCGGDKHCTGLTTPKRGIACAQSYLGLYEVGDMSMKTAMRNGRISKVTSIDKGQTSILFMLYREHCIYVHGK